MCSKPVRALPPGTRNDPRPLDLTEGKDKSYRLHNRGGTKINLSSTMFHLNTYGSDLYANAPEPYQKTQDIPYCGTPTLSCVSSSTLLYQGSTCEMFSGFPESGRVSE